MSNSDRQQLPLISGPADFATAFAVSPETLARLVIYAETLALWQPRINLVARGTIPDLWHRHFADSAQLLALAPASAEISNWIDLGSGAGFPGLVIAILLADAPEPRPTVILVESDQRKCAFLAEVVRKTGLATRLSVEILCARIENSATRAKVDTAQVVSARALAPLGKLFELAAPMLGPDSCALFPKGRNTKAEIEAARQAWQFSCDVVPSRTDAEAHIVRVRGSVTKAHA